MVLVLLLLWVDSLLSLEPEARAKRRSQQISCILNLLPRALTVVDVGPVFLFEGLILSDGQVFFGVFVTHFPELPESHSLSVLSERLLLLTKKLLFLGLDLTKPNTWSAISF